MTFGNELEKLTEKEYTSNELLLLIKKYYISKQNVTDTINDIYMEDTLKKAILKKLGLDEK